MTNEEFDTLVFKLEHQARGNPGRYQFRVLILALLGNAYLSAILLLLTALVVALVVSITVLKAFALKLIFVVGFFLWVLLRALWVKVPPPQGTEIQAREAPDLFKMLEDLRRKLGAPRFHHILITEDFNAGVVQAPQLGIFGWHRNYLLIGLPLMKSLSVEQFKAVLAHELGHLAKGHGRLSNWVYRQRLRWSRLMDVLDARESKGSFLFKPFLNWYAPYFNAYSFPLARANEYEADAASARLTSARAAAEALTSVSVVGSYLGERYWPHIHKQVHELPQPGFTPYRSMAQRVATELDESSAKTWLERALAEQTTSADTHPALVDRLKAIGESAQLAPPTPGRAADQLLGSVLVRITEAFDRRWRDNILPSWEERHREVQEERRRLAELDMQYQNGMELSLQDAFERAKLTESIGNNADAALDQFRTLHEREKSNAILCYSLGVRLLARDDGMGYTLIEDAIRLDEDTTVSGCEALRDYCARLGKKEEARAWHQRLTDRVELQQLAYKERNRITLKDTLERPDLPDDTLEDLRIQLQAIIGLRKAYFVKKRVKYLSHRPCYILGFTVTGVLQLHNKRRAAEVLEQVRTTVNFPGETFILNCEGDNYRFGRKLRWLRWARVI